MTRDEHIKACKQIHERARYLRRTFLNSVAVIDRKISLILTDYFCTSDEDKKRLFFTKVVNAHFFSLNSKIEVLVSIVKNDYSNYWEENGEVLRNLTDIIRFRNKLSHSVVDVSDEALARPIEEGIGFIEWKGGLPITDNEFNDWEVKANMVSGCLGDIKRLLPYIENQNFTDED
jgi:hypothetical protein